MLEPKPASVKRRSKTPLWRKTSCKRFLNWLENAVAEWHFKKWANPEALISERILTNEAGRAAHRPAYDLNETVSKGSKLSIKASLRNRTIICKYCLMLYKSA